MDKVIANFMAEIELEENNENTNTAAGIDTETESEIDSLDSCRTLSEWNLMANVELSANMLGLLS